MDRFALPPRRIQPRADRLPLDAVGDDDRGNRAAVGDQRHDLRDDRLVGLPPVEESTRARREGRVADGTAVARRGAGMHPDVLLRHTAPLPDSRDWDRIRRAGS